ncbi:hypothetical protein [Metabacillus fastidiosus]|uniref:hypothetical protein n=1 Tax=Metabacillus fastidiosus TaxID=1458 RepID=UPI003D291492
MSKLLNFQEENEQDCQYIYCDLVDETAEEIYEANNKAELTDELLLELLSVLVSKARNIARHEGIEEALIADINFKRELLDDLNGECNCEECCDGCFED